MASIATMPFVRSVCRAMEKIAPLRLAEFWDNVGLIIDAPRRQDKAYKNNVLLTIDMTKSVVDEAISMDANIIVTYHTPIFRPLKSLRLSDPLQTNLLRCTQAGISVFCPHTSLDAVHGGINDWLASIIGQGTTSVLEEKDETGGAGRLLKLQEVTPFQDVVVKIKRSLGLHRVQIALPDQMHFDDTVGSVAICAGSGGSMLTGVEADVYFTGEMAHHEVLESIASGHAVILCGHTNTERGYLPALSERLRDSLKEEYADVHVAVSTTDAHPLRLV